MFCLKNFKAKVIHIASFRLEIPTGDSEIGAGAQCAVQVPEASSQHSPWEKAKQREHSAGRASPWAPVTMAGGCHWADMPTLSQAPHPASLATWLPTRCICLVGLSSSLPPSFLSVFLYTGFCF